MIAEARAQLADDIAVTIIAEPDGMGLTYDQAHAIGRVLAARMRPLNLVGPGIVAWLPPRPI